MVTQAAPPSAAMSAFSRTTSEESQPSRSLAETGTPAGSASRTARTISRMRLGCFKSVAPPSWRLTVGAGHPKLMSMACAPAAQAANAASAMRPASPPKSCTCTGRPLRVRAPSWSSGTWRRNTLGGGISELTRRNSETAKVKAPDSAWKARMGASVSPCIGARRSAGVSRVSVGKAIMESL